MQPFSYTSVKIIHDDKIQEALQHQRPDAGQKPPQQGLRQMIRTVLARFNGQPAQKREERSAGCPSVASLSMSGHLTSGRCSE